MRRPRTEDRAARYITLAPRAANPIPKPYVNRPTTSPYREGSLDGGACCAKRASSSSRYCRRVPTLTAAAPDPPGAGEGCSPSPAGRTEGVPPVPLWTGSMMFVTRRRWSRCPSEQQPGDRGEQDAKPAATQSTPWCFEPSLSEDEEELGGVQGFVPGLVVTRRSSGEMDAPCLLGEELAARGEPDGSRASRRACSRANRRGSFAGRRGRARSGRAGRVLGNGAERREKESKLENEWLIPSPEEVPPYALFEVCCSKAYRRCRAESRFLSGTSSLDRGFFIGTTDHLASAFTPRERSASNQRRAF